MSEVVQKSGQVPPSRTPDQIEADIVDTRERLVGTIGELEERLNPKKVADRGTRKVKSFYVGDGGPRWDHIAMTAGAVVVGLVGLRVVSRTVRWALGATPPPAIPEDLVYVPVPRSQVSAFASLAGAPVQ